jgi:hypothetical protein
MRILDYLFCSCCVNRIQFRQALVFGLEGGGKSLLLRRAALDDPTGELPPAPTIGFAIETVPLKIDNASMVVIGSVVSRVRPLLDSWFTSCDAIVFVIDASDQSKLADAATELRLLGETSGLARKPLLVLFEQMRCRRRNDDGASVSLFGANVCVVVRGPLVVRAAHIDGDWRRSARGARLDSPRNAERERAATMRYIWLWVWSIVSTEIVDCRMSLSLDARQTMYSSTHGRGAGVAAKKVQVAVLDGAD